MLLLLAVGTCVLPAQEVTPELHRDITEVVAQDAAARLQRLRSGLAEACPTMAHIICLQMMHNQDYLVRFVAGAQVISRANGEAQISPQSWAEMDAQFHWPDGVSTQAFWK